MELERWMDAERANNSSGERLFLYADINWKIRWAYSSWNYSNNLTYVYAHVCSDGYVCPH